MRSKAMLHLGVKTTCCFLTRLFLPSSTTRCITLLYTYTALVNRCTRASRLIRSSSYQEGPQSQDDLTVAGHRTQRKSDVEVVHI
ncbi:hypothetical protein BC629DRAFT_1118764 [Irpex lacteus]|nr:hypothetical protein BC629DRAFT_1118764 [Irpex lacteus]